MKAFHRVALAATAVMTVACGGSKDSTSPTPPASIAGTWRAFFRGDSIIAQISQSGSALGGTALEVTYGETTDTIAFAVGGTYTPPSVHMVFTVQSLSSHLDGTVSNDGRSITGQVADDEGALGSMTLVKQ
jgi:hypothetical protein